MKELKKKMDTAIMGYIPGPLLVPLIGDIWSLRSGYLGPNRG